MRAHMVLSKDAEGAPIGKVIEQSEKILAKGAPHGKGAKVVSWTVEQDVLSLEIKSGKWVRPVLCTFRMKPESSRSM